MRNRFCSVLLALAVMFVPQALMAQSWPSKPIRFVIPFGPGSATDTLSRIMANDMSQTLGQPIVIVHKPGADGALAGVEVKRSAPDGYTFLFGTNSPYSVVPNMRKEPPYDVVTDFTPISYLGDNTFFVVTHPSLPVKSIAELVAHAKSNPGKINHAAGNTFALVAGGMFARANGIEIQPIPYKSEPDAITDLLSGRVQMMFGTSTTTVPQAKAGALRVLATMFHERVPLMPDAPSFIEAGQKKLPISAWFALTGPAGLPADIVQRMSKEVAASLAKPSVREPMEKQGFIPRSSSPEELAATIKDQLVIWKQALKDAGIEPN